MMQKNEIVKVKIEDIGVGGEGIGKVDGYTLFIKDAIIGDVVEAKVMKAKKNYGYARLMNVLTPSKDRVEEPVCPCLLYTSPSPRDGLLSRMPSSA